MNLWITKNLVTPHVSPIIKICIRDHPQW